MVVVCHCGYHKDRGKCRVTEVSLLQRKGLCELASLERRRPYYRGRDSVRNENLYSMGTSISGRVLLVYLCNKNIAAMQTLACPCGIRR